MHIYGIVDMLAAILILVSDFSIGWMKWSIFGVLVVKGLHSQLM